jgi:rare lipoprotein A
MMQNVIRPMIFGLLGAVAIIAFAYAVLAMTVPSRAASGCAGTIVKASWYGTESGHTTANGEPFNGRSLTAAHRTLPFNTRLLVTYQGKSVKVRINDRGPHIKGRTLDLSEAAAKRIGLIHAGVAKVCLTRLR